MLFEPSYMSPYLSTINANSPLKFSCSINASGGTMVNKYNLTIKNSEGVQIYTTGDTSLSPVVYNEDTLNINRTSTGVINGLDYTWSIKLYESNPTIWVTSGTVQSTSTNLNIYIRKHYQVSAGMYLKIGNEIRQIATYSSSTGLAVLSYVLSSVPSIGTQYDILKNYVLTNDIPFKARSTPLATITNAPTTLNEKSYEFLGSYSQSENVSWKYYTWNLYKYNALTENELIKTSGKITGGKIKFLYNGFLNNTTYVLSLIMESQDGVIADTTYKTFNVSYGESTISNQVTLENIQSKNAIGISWSPTIDEEIIGWELYKKEDSDSFLTYINSYDVNLTSAIDYNVKNKTEYTYYIFPVSNTKIYSAIVSDKIVTCWWNWSIIELIKGESDDLYYANTDNIWKFRANLKSNTINQNMDKFQYDGFSKRTKISIGPKNYMSGSISCLIGDIDLTNSQAYINDNVEKISNFMEFVRADSKKLLRDIKGNSWLVDTISHSYDTDITNKYYSTTITFEWCEIGNVSEIRIVES